MNLAKIFISAFLIDNVVILRFIALCPFIGIRKRIGTSPIPAFLKGSPILFICTGLLSMAFMGFSGLIK